MKGRPTLSFQRIGKYELQIMLQPNQILDQSQLWILGDHKLATSVIVETSRPGMASVNNANGTSKTWA